MPTPTRTEVALDDLPLDVLLGLHRIARTSLPGDDPCLAALTDTVSRRLAGEERAREIAEDGGRVRPNHARRRAR